MLQLPKIQVNPAKVIVDATIRLSADMVLSDFKVKVPPFHNDRQYAVLVMDYGFTKMLYTRNREVHFASSLHDWPQLIEGLRAYLKECKRQRINAMNLASVVFSPSDYCHEFAAIAEANDLEGGSWNVHTNRFTLYTL